MKVLAARGAKVYQHRAPGALLEAFRESCWESRSQMSLSVTALRRYPHALTQDLPEVQERSVRRRIKIAYSLLCFNTLTFTAGYSVIPFPSKVGKGHRAGDPATRAADPAHH